jgi:DNA-binding beta-propeller fold protein YncE
MARPSTLLLALGALLWLAAGCADDGAADESGGGGVRRDASGGWYPSDAGGGSADANLSRPDAGDPPPPEREQEFQAPAAGNHFVFVLHPAREQVIVVDARSLRVTLAAVGLRPTVLATAPGHDVAVVINAGGHDLSVLRARFDGTRVTNVPAVPGVNRLALSPDGRHAVAFFSFDALEPGQPVGSLQSVTVARLAADDVQAVEVGTGFHPISVAFSDDGGAAYVVTEEGVTAVPLTGDLPDIGVLPTTPVTANPLEAALEREVLVTPDGSLAIVRTLGQSALSLVDLGTGAITRFDLPGEPTDVDLTPDGETVLVMLRAAQTALLGRVADIRVGAAAFRTVDLGGVPMGAAVISPAGDTALLYTTVDDVEALLRLELTAATLRPIRLQKTVRAVAYGPTGARAVVLHRTSGAAALPTLPLDAFVDASQAFSVVDLGAAVARLQLVDHAPGDIAFSPGGARLYVLLPDPLGVAPAVADVDLLTLMGVERPLASPPIAIQPVPAAGKVAVSQEHPTGRITFFDVESGASETLTGFELGGLVD